MKKRRLVLAASLLAPQAADAAPITRTYTVASLFPAGSPIAGVTNSFTLTFDPTVFVDNQPIAAFSSSSAAAQFQGAIGYTIFTSDALLFGQLFPDVNLVASNVSEFRTTVFIDPAGAVVRPGDTQYGDAATNRIYTSTSQTAVSAVVANAVPEPDAWTLMLLGFGAAGYAVRRARADLRLNRAA